MPAMQNRLRKLSLVWLVLTPSLVRAVTVTPDELAEARRWTAARFEGAVPDKSAKPALVVHANHDSVQKNARGGKPMRLGERQFRGLFCSAFSKLRCDCRRRERPSLRLWESIATSKPAAGAAAWNSR
jgi:hypothetical protein